jgi:hypothetical protein
MSHDEELRRLNICQLTLEFSSMHTAEPGKQSGHKSKPEYQWLELNSVNPDRIDHTVSLTEHCIQPNLGSRVVTSPSQSTSGLN